MSESKKKKLKSESGQTPEGVVSHGEGYRVLLFDDDDHTMDAVVGQLVKALSCPVNDAISIMLRAHTRGRAVVTITSRTHAQIVAKILREIELEVKVDRV